MFASASCLRSPAKAGIQFFLCSSFQRKLESISFSARHSGASWNPALSPLVIPAQAGIQFDLALAFLPRSQSFHSSCGGAGHFLLSRQEKVTKEKATPNVAPCGHPALRVRSRPPGFSGLTSLYVRKT